MEGPNFRVDACPAQIPQAIGNLLRSKSGCGQEEALSAPLETQKAGAAVICQEHMRCSIAPVTQETLTQMLP